MNKAVVLGCNYYIGLSIIRCLGREGVITTLKTHMEQSQNIYLNF